MLLLLGQKRMSGMLHLMELQALTVPTLIPMVVKNTNFQANASWILAGSSGSRDFLATKMLNPKLLPKHLKTMYELHCKPIYEMMECTNKYLSSKIQNRSMCNFLKTLSQRLRSTSRHVFIMCLTSAIQILTPGKFQLGQNMSRDYPFYAMAQNRTRLFSTRETGYKALHSAWETSLATT